MKILNVLWAYAVYFVANVILYRRDWRELRNRRGGRFRGSGTSSSVTEVFKLESRAEAKMLEPLIKGAQLTIKAEDSLLGAHSTWKKHDTPRGRQVVQFHPSADKYPDGGYPTEPNFKKD